MDSRLTRVRCRRRTLRAQRSPGSPCAGEDPGHRRVGVRGQPAGRRARRGRPRGPRDDPTPGRYEGAGRPIAGDVGEERSLREALEGCEAAYYLVHSLDHPDFERKDADAARAFARAAAATGIDRIIYLGGLGQDGDRLSRHLRSRREVERLLGGTGVPVTVLRAGIVVGHGGVSWELTRQLVAHLPAMVTPRWVSTRTQPIAVADVVRYLVGVLDAS